MSNEVINLSVEGMSCNHCVMSIKTSVGALDGVENVDVDLAGKKVTVEYNPEKVQAQNIKDTIEDQGYEIK